MAQCLTPYTKKDTGLNFPCGKCYHCKARRISGWSYRILKEYERATNAHFITLTYDTDFVSITPNHFLTLWKPDFQNYMKLLRKQHLTTLKYYAVGEYGTKSGRPHYHAIIFNADQEKIIKQWKFGNVHFGELNAATAGYTLKYIAKTGRIPMHKRDDRVPEFSLMSKKLGDNYLTNAKKKWHKADLTNRYYLPIEDGKKIALPRYYKEKIYTKLQRQLIGNQLENNEHVENSTKTVDKKLQELAEKSLINQNFVKKSHQRYEKI